MDEVDGMVRVLGTVTYWSGAVGVVLVRDLVETQTANLYTYPQFPKTPPCLNLESPDCRLNYPASKASIQLDTQGLHTIFRDASPHFHLGQPDPAEQPDLKAIHPGNQRLAPIYFSEDFWAS